MIRNPYFLCRHWMSLLLLLPATIPVASARTLSAASQNVEQSKPWVTQLGDWLILRSPRSKMCLSPSLR